MKITLLYEFSSYSILNFVPNRRTLKFLEVKCNPTNEKECDLTINKSE